MLYLTLRQYEYVTAIAQHGSLSTAAEALHVSQPALSAALTRIEEVVGDRLFLRRRGAALVMTRRGRLFAKHAAGLIRQAEILERPNDAAVTSERISVGMFADLAPFLMAPALKSLRQAQAHLDISWQAVSFETLIAALNSGRLDLAITYDLGLDAGFQKTELTRATPKALVPPSHLLARQASVTLSELAEHDLILSHEGLSIQHMLGLFRKIGKLPKVAHRANSLELLRSLAANGEGVGLSYSDPASPNSYDGKPLIAVPVADRAAIEPIVLVTNTGTRISGNLLCAQNTLIKNLSAAGLAD